MLTNVNCIVYFAVYRSKPESLAKVAHLHGSEALRFDHFGPDGAISVVEAASSVGRMTQCCRLKFRGSLKNLSSII